MTPDWKGLFGKAKEAAQDPENQAKAKDAAKNFMEKRKQRERREDSGYVTDYEPGYQGGNWQPEPVDQYVPDDYSDPNTSGDYMDDVQDNDVDTGDEIGEDIEDVAYGDEGG